MSRMCPGQDTRYWRPEDIFEVTCSRCSHQVEFFKDDVSRRCPSCGGVIKNPKITLGCAQWCEHAKACLGYDPREAPDEGLEQGSLWDQLVATARVAYAERPDALAHALSVAGAAQQLLQSEPADRRTVLAAALFHDFEHEGQGSGDALPLSQLLAQAGLDRHAVGEVTELVGHHRQGRRDSAESRVLWDAHLEAERLVAHP